MEYILSKISPYRDLKSSMLVCRRWYRLASGMFHVNNKVITLIIGLKLDYCVLFGNSDKRNCTGYISFLYDKRNCIGYNDNIIILIIIFYLERAQ
jgi:hypothetical protein